MHINRSRHIVQVLYLWYALAPAITLPVRLTQILGHQLVEHDAPVARALLSHLSEALKLVLLLLVLADLAVLLSLGRHDLVAAHVLLTLTLIVQVRLVELH